MTRLLELFNIKGGPIMGIWSLAMIGLSIYSTIKGKAIDGSVAAMYTAAVAAYAGSKGYESFQQAKAAPPATVTVNKVDIEEGDI